MPEPRSSPQRTPEGGPVGRFVMLAFSALTLVLVALAVRASPLAPRPGVASAAASGAVAAPTPASATGAVTAPGRLWPWAVSAATVGGCAVTCTLVIDDSAEPHSLLPISFPGAPGVGPYHQAMLSRFTGAVPGPSGVGGDGAPRWDWSVEIAPGRLTGPTLHDLGQLFRWDAQRLCAGGQASCAAAYAAGAGGADNPARPGGTVCTADARCARVGVVPVIAASPAPLRPGATVAVTGFRCLYLIGYRLEVDGLVTVVARTVPNCVVP